MLIGIPKEIKRDEYRVGLLPVGAEELTRAGHRVLIEAGAAQAPASATTSTSATERNWLPRPRRFTAARK